MASPILCRTLISLLSFNNRKINSHFSLSLNLNLSTDTSNQPIDTSKATKFLIKKHHFSPASANHIASLSRLQTLENAHSILQFLKEIGFSTAQLEKILKTSPHLLSSDLDDNIKPKIDIFLNFGFTNEQIVSIIAKQSRFLNHSALRILSAVSVLTTALGSTAAAAKFLKSSGGFLCDMEATFLPNVEFLKRCGVPMEQIVQLSNTPQLFLHKPENFRRFVEKADEMGSDRSSRSYIRAVRALSSMKSERWELKLQTLRDLGFSEEDIVRAFRNLPQVFTTSTEKLRRVAEVLLGAGKYDRAEIVGNPCVFQYSIERRIKPRLEVLRVLEERKLIGDWPRLATMMLLTDADFFRKFVAPYLDQVGDLWSGVDEKMRRVGEFLLGMGKYDRAEIVGNPRVFEYSIETRIRPRVEVLRVLEEKGLIEKWPRLASLVMFTNANFFGKFVAPYLDQVGDLWSGVGEKGEVKD